jgi:hypothetical protein
MDGGLMIPSIRLQRQTIVSANKARAASDARVYYGAVAVCNVSPPRPSRTNLPQFNVTYIVIDTAAEPIGRWGGGDVWVTDLIGKTPRRTDG